MLWEKPVYKFREPIGPVNLKEVAVDVTGSAPPFHVPSPNFKRTVTEIFSADYLERIETVLEFGAAKLKNIPWLLEQGKSVAAVEFKELAENTATKKNIRKCRKYGAKFQELIFPHPFLSDPRKFDLVILANMMPVMPVFGERLYLLNLLHKKVNDGKYVFWIAQKEGTRYKEIREAGKNKLGDGIWMGEGRKYKTFYKYHRPDELDELMGIYGFERIKIWSGGDDARLYKKIDHCVFDGVVTPEFIREKIPIDNTIGDPISGELKIVRQSASVKPVLSNPDALCIENLYINKLKGLPAGPDNAEAYHRLTSWALARIFRGQLSNMAIKVVTAHGTKIIDTVFTNAAQAGFFSGLKNKGNYVSIEAKNYSADPVNPEFDQLNGRLNPDRGNVG